MTVIDQIIPPHAPDADDFGDLASALIACGVLSDEAAAALEDQQ